jgi:uncharacterized protein YcbX
MSTTPSSYPSGVVGRVAALRRYPVKSMGTQILDKVDVTWYGLAGDRRWAFIRDGQQRNGFPWLTLRQRNDLNHYRPFFTDTARPDTSPTLVRTPTGDEYDVADPTLAAELGEGVRVLKQDRGVFDSMPLSLITIRTITGLQALVGADIDVLRFRPNLLIDTIGDEPFPEDTWVGRVLRVGGIRMRVDRRDKRCGVVNIDPVTARRDPVVLETIARERQVCLGVYGSVVEPGHVAVGDPVALVDG